MRPIKNALVFELRLAIGITITIYLFRTNVRITSFMASPSTATRLSARRHRPLPGTRFDKRLAEIVRHATAVLCVKGYEGVSMRALSRAVGVLRAGLAS